MEIVLLRPFFQSLITKWIDFLCFLDKAEGSHSLRANPFMEDLILSRFHRIWHNSPETWQRTTFDFLCSKDEPDGSLLLKTEPSMENLIVNRFHYLWYHSPDTWLKNTYMGHGIQQFPLDLHLYQELIWELKPAFILQTGVADGGSILFFANMLDLIGVPDSLVIGVDINLSPRALTVNHPKVRLIEGSSTDPEIVERIRATVPQMGGFVSLDSDHSKEHVAAEIKIYKEFVGIGSYLVVEDTNINGHPVLPGFGPGPKEAVDEFLNTNRCFIKDDAAWSRNKISFHTWLRRTC